MYLTAFVTDDLNGLHKTKRLECIDENVLLRQNRLAEYLGGLSGCTEACAGHCGSSAQPQHACRTRQTGASLHRHRTQRCASLYDDICMTHVGHHCVWERGQTPT